MFGATDVENLTAKQMANKHFCGRLGYIEIIGKNYCSTFTSPNLHI
jgi:hypothetical protein